MHILHGLALCRIMSFLLLGGFALLTLLTARLFFGFTPCLLFSIPTRCIFAACLLFFKRRTAFSALPLPFVFGNSIGDKLSQRGVVVPF